MSTQLVLSQATQARIELECELLARWFPQMFPSTLMWAIEQGKIHGGLFVDPDTKGCGDFYGHLLGLPTKWEEAAELSRGVIAALQLDGEDMTPLQRWTADVAPGQTHRSNKHLAILYKDILPKYLRFSSGDRLVVTPVLSIFPVYDQVQDGQAERQERPLCWYRLTKTTNGLIVHVFRARPDKDTPDKQALGSVDIDTFDKRLQVLIWDSKTLRQQNDPVQSVIIARNIAG